MVCTGDSSERCGGSEYLNLYQNPASNLPASLNTVGSYGFVGCCADSQTNRALADMRRDDPALTLESFAAFCKSGGYTYIGSEYGGECYRAQQRASFSTDASIWDCNMGCLGNSSEACGAANRLTLYKLPVSSSNGTSQSTSKRSAGKKRHNSAHFHGHGLS